MAEPTQRDRERAVAAVMEVDLMCTGRTPLRLTVGGMHAVVLVAQALADQRARHVDWLRACADASVKDESPTDIEVVMRKTLNLAADALEADHE